MTHTTSHDQSTWTEIAEHISAVEGEPISRSRCQQVANKALKKLAIGLADFPEIRDWAMEAGVELPHAD
tara:strand:- start:5494 stop:5700 length:207 start_codon:yes stop_codon:yes gene_type:complete